MFIHIKWKTQAWIGKGKEKTKKWKKINYQAPKLTTKEEIVCLVEGVAIIALFSYFFYRSLLAFLVLSPGLWFYRKNKQKRMWKKKKEKLEEEFKETLLAIQTNLQSGYSIENAFVESHKYITGIYGDNSDMAQELLWIKRGLQNGSTLEQLLNDLGKRCPESALEDFAEIYTIVCKTGCDWNEIIEKIAASVITRIEIQEEINILIHGKKTESKIMCVIPFLILYYMDATSKGYFEVMYHNIIGIVIMTICMVAYIFAFVISEKITDII